MANEIFTPGRPDTDILVVFFSSKGIQANGNLEKGNTAVFAEEIARQTGADLFELVSPEGIYPDNLMPLQGIARREVKDNSRPAFTGDVPNFGKYRAVFIGGPAWYMSWPAINYTFLDSHDLTGKTLIPFATYVGSGLNGIDAKMKRLYPTVTQLQGLALKGADAQKMKESTQNEIRAWLTGLTPRMKCASSAGAGTSGHCN